MVKWTSHHNTRTWKGYRQPVNICWMNKWNLHSRNFDWSLSKLKIQRDTGFRMKQSWAKPQSCRWSSIMGLWAVSKPFWFLVFSCLKTRIIPYFARLSCKGIYIKVPCEVWNGIWIKGVTINIVTVSCYLALYYTFFGVCLFSQTRLKTPWGHA